MAEKTKEERQKTYNVNLVLEETCVGSTTHGLTHNMTDYRFHDCDFDGHRVIVTGDGRIMEEPDHKHYSDDALQQIAEQEGGRIIDPENLRLEDFVWAIRLLNKTDNTKDRKIIPEQDFTAWEKCFGLIGAIETLRKGKFTAKAKYGPEWYHTFDDIFVRIVPGESFCHGSFKIRGYELFTEFEIRVADENILRRGLDIFLEKEQEAGRLDRNICAHVKGKHDKEGKYRINVNLYWQSWDRNRSREEQEANITLPEIYEMNIPRQLEIFREMVQQHYRSEDDRQADALAAGFEATNAGLAEKFAESGRIRERNLREAIEKKEKEAAEKGEVYTPGPIGLKGWDKAPKSEEGQPLGYVPKEFGHGWVGPRPPPKGLEDPDSDKSE